MKTIRTTTTVGVFALAMTLGACNQGSSGAASSAPGVSSSSSDSGKASSSSTAASNQSPGRSSSSAGAAAPAGKPSTVTKTTSAAPARPATPSCGTMTSAQATQLAVRKAPKPFPGMSDMPGWTTENAEDHYDPCADLSWITITIPGGTASSPYQIALFHRGTYLGTATKDAYGFGPNVTRLSGSSIQSVYTYTRGMECTACATGRATARFTWNEAQQKVVMTGSVPPAS